MRLFLCLFLLALSGIGWLVAPPDLLKLQPVASTGLFNSWQISVGAFAVPLVLAILKFSKGKTIPLLSLLWGAWVGLLTVLSLFELRQWVPDVTPYGVLFLLAVLVFSFGVIFSSIVALFPKASK